MINKYLLLLIASSGIFIGNNWIIASIIPALFINFVIYVTIKYAERMYNPFARKVLLYKDLKDLNNDIIVNIIVVTARLSLAASTFYLLWLMYLKLFGIFS